MTTNDDHPATETVPGRNRVPRGRPPGSANPRQHARRPVGLRMAEYVHVSYANPAWWPDGIRLDGYSGDHDDAEHIGSAILVSTDAKAVEALAVRLLDVADDLRRWQR